MRSVYTIRQSVESAGGPLWVSSAEKRALEAAAKRAGVSISEFIRRAVDEKIEREGKRE